MVKGKSGIAVFFAEKSEMNQSVPLTGKVTLPRTNLQALLLALKVAKHYSLKKLLIHLRSDYVQRLAIIYY
jgi:ribonuclease HI